MVSEWVEKSLVDLCSIIKRGIGPKYIEEGGVLVINQRCIRDQRVSLSEARRNDPEKKKIPEDRYVQPGDVLINSTGVGTLGRVAQIKDVKNPTTVDSHVTIARLNDKSVDSTFFGWSIKYLQPVIEELGEGSTGQTELSRHRIGELNINIPPIPEQKAIAHVLGSLDDKIELNRRMNETLEGMAQALFKSWFVDFDPVIDNALAAGNPIPEPLAQRAETRRQALANGTANRESAQAFPASFRFTEELGWIPEGWEVKPFESLLEKTIGGDWGKENEDEKHSIPAVIIRGTDMPSLSSGNISSAPTRWVEPKKFASRELKDADIVIEISGGSPKQPTGRSLFITDNILDRLGGKVEPASFCRKFSPHNKEFGLLGALHLKHIYDEGKMWEYQNQSTGISNFQTKTFLSSELLSLPESPEVLAIFYAKVRPLIDKLTNNQQIHLAKLRDVLLPKLISGELRIPQAEKMVEEAIA